MLSNPDRERQIPYDLTYIKKLETKKKLIDTENRLLVTRSGALWMAK